LAVPEQPLVVAPSTPPPSPLDLAVDLLLPTLTSAAAFSAIIGGGIESPSVQALLIGGALAAPAAGLVALREHPFALDCYFASASGGVLGMLAGMGLTRLLLPADAGLARVPYLAIGQGLGAAAGYHVYRLAKPHLDGLDRLPEHRTDDPLNWDRWKERHHNE
jgi:hypothetical protein